MRLQRVEDTMLRDPRGEMILVAFLLDVRSMVSAMSNLLAAGAGALRIDGASPFARWTQTRCMEAWGRLQGGNRFPLVFSEPWDWRQVEE